jgi:pyruvate, orthophosphate dikinase
MSTKHVYFFGNQGAEGQSVDRTLLGGKGIGLHEMVKLGLPVPPGFTLSTQVCRHFFETKGDYPAGLLDEVREAMAKVESEVGARFADPKSPLLVSVRSGAPASMPGMMDTVLNLGLNQETVKGLAANTGNPRFAYDSYRRFIQMYGEVVLGVAPHAFESLLLNAKMKRGVAEDSDLSASEMESVVAAFLELVKKETGHPFPESPQDQLWGAIAAVFRSWMSNRAVSYRRIHKIPEDWGTAVTVQAMVFGNMGDDSATGVAFTRDPSTGEKKFFGEFLSNAQGEDVVAGIRTPLPMNVESSQGAASSTMDKLFPGPYADLVQLYQKLEKHYRDMQDIEFTVQKGKLYLLQTRSGKRTASASVRIAVDMVKEGLISEEEAILRVTPAQVEQLLHPRLDPRAKKEIVARGLPASPGAASGQVVFSSEDADKFRKEQKSVILVRHETSPEDIVGMDAAVGILTALGGMTSHAAVVARGLGKPCVAGCGAISIDYPSQEFTVGHVRVKHGDWITIDGATGEVILGKVATINSQLDQYFNVFMEWVDKRRKLRVRANADTPHDAKVARQFGAEGVGLCRTEHMFFESTRIQAVREMILASTQEERLKAIARLFPMQKEDFIGIFREMAGCPVTIRLLDPPLHEFLPKTEDDIRSIAMVMGISADTIRSKVKSLHEFNPMLGHRGCRLGVTYPEIYEMQVRAILEAAGQLRAETGLALEPEILVPFISTTEELTALKELVERTGSATCQRLRMEIPYSVGTMIEIPRAAFVADELAQQVSFFSFGTNDLTQMTFGLSRDDAGAFMPTYIDKGYFREDPFVTLDQRGVGEIMRIACERGRKTNASLKVGICGEHGGDATTVEFCHRLGFNYVSCSPFRVPVARLAAAQATLRS